MKKHDNVDDNDDDLKKLKLKDTIINIHEVNNNENENYYNDNKIIVNYILNILYNAFVAILNLVMLVGSIVLCHMIIKNAKIPNFTFISKEMILIYIIVEILVRMLGIIQLNESMSKLKNGLLLNFKEKAGMILAKKEFYILYGRKRLSLLQIFELSNVSDNTIDIFNVKTIQFKIEASLLLISTFLMIIRFVFYYKTTTKLEEQSEEQQFSLSSKYTHKHGSNGFASLLIPLLDLVDFINLHYMLYYCGLLINSVMSFVDVIAASSPVMLQCVVRGMTVVPTFIYFPESVQDVVIAQDIETIQEVATVQEVVTIQEVVAVQDVVIVQDVVAAVTVMTE
ncbi:12677_t:CDS:2 [Entrophospora sp. SA101]|nr:14148_t:CDS:2 [Entrophospora sp. SA101]CAJ0838110.1 12677_t:CDS:2 [Entrophospora sp. SA101]